MAERLRLYGCMPIFEYRCPNCESTFERIVPNETSKAPCPKCGSEKTEKLLSTFAVSGGGRKDRGSCAPSGGT